MRLRPNYADAYTGMGVSLKELRRRTEAQACFETCVRLRPGCALSLGNLAGLYYEQVGCCASNSGPVIAGRITGTRLLDMSQPSLHCC